jgi:uncharacterized protein (TIGR04255 family)
MARRRHLKNAPIVEAIVDFRVKLPAEFKVKSFASIKEQLGDSYPQMEGRREIETGITVKGKRVEHIVEEKGLQGYLFKSPDGKNVAQFRNDGFTFSRLKPYTEWQDVLAEARKLWKLYKNRASPVLVTRIAVRYINQLDIPLPIEDLAKYLHAPPTIPQSFPQELSRFLTRVTVRDPKFDIMAHVIQALERGSKRGSVTIILDIDVFKQKESGFGEREMWQTFKQLRHLKNRIFFGSITEKTARLFE